jgi:hypothetical protein
MWEPRLLTPLWAFTACYRDSFFYLHLPDLIINQARNQQKQVASQVASAGFFLGFLFGPEVGSDKFL